MTQATDSAPTSRSPLRRFSSFWLPALSMVTLIAAVALAVNSLEPKGPAAARVEEPPVAAVTTSPVEAPTVGAHTPAPAGPSATPPPVSTSEPPAPAALPAEELVIPLGTPVTLALDAAISTKTAQVGDRVTGRIVQPVMVGGRVALPRNAAISGRVIVAEQPGKASGRGRLQFAFETARFGDRAVALNSRSAQFQGRSGAKRDRELIGGGAAAGGVLGGVIGGSLGDAAKGAVLGGAAGGAVSLMTRGPQLEFAAGAQIRFTLDQPVRVPVDPAS